MRPAQGAQTPRNQPAHKQTNTATGHVTAEHDIPSHLVRDLVLVLNQVQRRLHRGVTRGRKASLHANSNRMNELRGDLTINACVN
jgi:hypothetical protein